LLDGEQPYQYKEEDSDSPEEKAAKRLRCKAWIKRASKTYKFSPNRTEWSESHLLMSKDNGLHQVPFEDELEQIIANAHVVNFHPANETMNKLHERKLCWNRMQSDVELYLEKCLHCCERRKLAPEEKIKTKNSIYCKRPFERFQIDLTLLKLHHGINEGTHYMMVVEDYFSRFAWAITITSKESRVTKEAFEILLDRVHGTYGMLPSIVQSDNGGEFKKSFAKFVTEEGIEHIRGAPRHPQSQGAVERLNKTLKNLLRERFELKTKSNEQWNKETCSKCSIYITPGFIARPNELRSN
jgi:transposase InsO family protein